ncbi:autotransporter-associated beta strand repeat-containing protein, partial [Salmonella enterica]|uniref:autotransporter-associated beta strand repeat-containing protein n=1 Tax=Salmonella enterica TaxID=28901 RepID=UPI001591CB9D
MNKTYNIIWNAARGMYIVTSELARSGSRAIVSVSASCAVTLLAMDAAPAVAEETRVSIPSQTTTYTLSGATPFVVEAGNTIATDTAASAAIVGDNSNDWDLLIESGAVVGSSLIDSQAMNLDSLTGATSVHNQGTITGSSADGTILLQNGGSVINDGRIENSAIYVHNLDLGAPEIDAAIYMLNGGSYVSSENGVLKGVSGVIVQSGEVHITNGGTINSDGSWRSYGVELRGGAYGTIVNTGTIITTASDGSGEIEDAAIYAHTFDDIAAGDYVSVDNSGLLQSDFIAVALYHGAHFEVINRAGGVITAGNSSLVGIQSAAMELKAGANNLVTNDGTISAYGTANTYGIHYGESTSGGVITNTGSITTTGHTLNNLAGGSITANTAVQFHGNNNTLANAGAILGDTNGVTISGSGNTLTNQGKITGGTNAILINSGSKNNTLTLNTGTEISGSITDDNNSASANNNLILDGEGTLGSSISGLNSVTSSGDWTLSGATMNLSGTTNSALWVKSGTLILNGAMTAKGATVDSGTTLQIGNSGTLGTFNGDIVDNGTLTFNRSDAAAYGSVISGSGNVVKQGGGELTLSNNNSYSGGTTIAEGTLTATAGGALGSGNIDNRAYLKLDAASASDPFIVADLTTHSGATVEIGAGSTLQANTLTQQDGSTLTADLTATSGPAIRAKNVNLDGTLNVASPASQEPIRSTDDLISLALIESDNAISGDFDGITINGNAMNPDAFITVVGQKNVNDTHYDLVETLTWYADRYNAAIDAHGTFNLADADDSFTVNTVLENVDANSGWNGQSLTKTGAGTLILNAENTYTGGTTISEGTLVANNVEALGTGNVTDNATLELNTGGDFDNAISGSGQVVKSGDKTLTLSGANSYTGGTTISGGTLVASNVEALGSGDVTDNATLELNTGGTFDNVISGSGQVVKSGDEMLTLSGANSYTGGTTISGGTLVASNVEALGSGDVTDNATLELNTGGDFDNAISGSGQVVKSGDDALTLSGNNSYTGGTLISDGTLVASNVEALGSGDVTNDAVLELNTGGDFDNAISGSGQVVKSGDKTLTLSGANSYTGGTDR